MPLDRRSLLTHLIATADPAPDANTLATHVDDALLAAHQVLNVGGAGLMLLDELDLLHAIGGSDQASSLLEQAQQQLGDGPCIDCVRDGRTVAVHDLSESYPAVWQFFRNRSASVGGRAFRGGPVGRRTRRRKHHRHAERDEHTRPGVDP